MNHTNGTFSTQDSLADPPPPAPDNGSIPVLSTSEFTREPDSAATIEPSPAREAFERGAVLKKAGLFKQAAAQFSQAAQDPAYAARGLAQMGLCLKVSGKKEEAVAVFQQAVQLSSGSSKQQVPILYLLGKTLESLGRTAEAVEAYRWIRREDPGYRDVAARMERLSLRRSYTGAQKPHTVVSAAWTEDLFKTWRGILRSSK